MAGKLGGLTQSPMMRTTASPLKTQELKKYQECRELVFKFQRAFNPRRFTILLRNSAMEKSNARLFRARVTSYSSRKLATLQPPTQSSTAMGAACPDSIQDFSLSQPAHSPQACGLNPSPSSQRLAEVFLKTTVQIHVCLLPK